jgi:hypothetical protein
VVNADGGLEYLGVFGCELVGSFPGEVGDLTAPSRQLLQRRVIHVGAEGQAVAWRARSVHVPEVSSVWL